MVWPQPDQTIIVLFKPGNRSTAMAYRLSSHCLGARIFVNNLVCSVWYCCTAGTIHGITRTWQRTLFVRKVRAARNVNAQIMALCSGSSTHEPDPERTNAGKASAPGRTIAFSAPRRRSGRAIASRPTRQAEVQPVASGRTPQMTQHVLAESAHEQLRGIDACTKVAQSSSASNWLWNSTFFTDSPVAWASIISVPYANHTRQRR